MALALIDVEFFKTVDDTHGHLAGDEVLCGLVREAQAGLAEADLLARWGGEEFLVLFPGGCPTVRRSGRSPAWGRTSPASRCTAGCRRAATCACWPATRRCRRRSPRWNKPAFHGWSRAKRHAGRRTRFSLRGLPPITGHLQVPGRPSSRLPERMVISSTTPRPPPISSTREGRT